MSGIPTYFIKESCSDDGYTKNEEGEKSYKKYKDACKIVENKDCHLRLTESEAFDRAEKFGRCAGLREAFQTNCVLPEARDEGHLIAIQNAKNSSNECRRFSRRIRETTITRNKQKKALQERDKSKPERLPKTPTVRAVPTKTQTVASNTSEKKVLTVDDVNKLLEEGMKNFKVTVPQTTARRSMKASGTKKSFVDKMFERSRRRRGRRRTRRKRRKLSKKKMS